MNKLSISLLAIILLIISFALIAQSAPTGSSSKSSNAAALKKRQRRHSYLPSDSIPVIAEKMWAKGNPSETYDYYYLPFCGSEKKESVRQDMGADVSGSRRKKTLYDLAFQVNTDHKQLCEPKTVSKDDLNKLRKAVQNKFMMLLYYDGLPIKVSIGKTLPATQAGTRPRILLFTHYNFYIMYNGDRVIEISAKPDLEKAVDINQDDITKITFSYSALWTPTEKKFENRMSKYVEMNFFSEEIEIQWFSILNSLILVVVLTSFLAFIITRILKRDYQAYAEDDEDEKEESGWKLLHANVFRFPPHVNLLASILGNGAQLLSLIFCILFLTLIGAYYSDYSNNAMYTSFIVVYALTTGISGYVSGHFYKQFGGENWVKNVLLTVSLFALPVFIVWACLNTTALAYESSAAFPFKTIAGILALYFLVSFPLQLVGAITAKNFSHPFDAPCRTNKVPREIPPSLWYKSGAVQILVAGFLPFSAIYIELYYLFVSIWGQFLYTPFPIVALVFIILIMVTSCITIAMIYVLISQENYLWWWKAVFCGGASSFFIYAYSIFFFQYESQMSGFLQSAFYFGYMFIACLALFFMMGSVGFYSALIFVKRIYRVIKSD